MFERVVRNTPSRNGAELKVMYYNIAACYDKLVRGGGACAVGEAAGLIPRARGAPPPQDRPKDVVRTSSAAIDIDPFYKKALHRRARALIALGGDENELQALGGASRGHAPLPPQPAPPRSPWHAADSARLPRGGLCASGAADLQVDFLHKVASSPHHAPDQAPEEYQESVKRVSRRRAAEAFPVRARRALPS